MDIIEFFQNSAGKWFSQRTVHNMTSGELVAGKSELEMTILPLDDPHIVKLCEKHQIDRNSPNLTGIKVTWEGTPSATSQKETGMRILLVLPSAENPQIGKLWQSGPDIVNKLVSNYSFGSDDVLTIVTEGDNLLVEERLWYLMPNLRMRSSVVRMAGLAQASFCSEVRRLS